MAKKTEAKDPVAAPRQKPSSLLDTRVIYCGDNLEQLAKLAASAAPCLSVVEKSLLLLCLVCFFVAIPNS